MTLYALRSEALTEAIDEDSEVLFESKHGWSFLEEAITLWRLVGSGRGDEILAGVDRAEQVTELGEFRLYQSELRDLVRLLIGVEDAVVASGILDKEWRVPADRLEELAKQVPGMDLKTERTLADKRFALAEVVNHAIGVRMFLAKALEAGCVVAVG